MKFQIQNRTFGIGLILAFSFSLFCLGGQVLPAFAEDKTVDLQIPLNYSSQPQKFVVCRDKSLAKEDLVCDGISNYIVAIYQWLIRASVILALLVIIIGGFQWMTAAGESKRVQGAKKTMTNALIGLLLALGSHTLLWLINPDLVDLKSITMRSIKSEELDLSEEDEPGEPVFDPSGTVVGTGFSHLKTRPKSDAAKDLRSGVDRKLMGLLKLLDTPELGSKLYISSLKKGRIGSLHELGQAADIHGKPEDLIAAANILWAKGPAEVQELFLGLDGAPGAILNGGKGHTGQPISIGEFKNFVSINKRTGDRTCKGCLWEQHSGKKLHLHVGSYEGPEAPIREP